MRLVGHIKVKPMPETIGFLLLAATGLTEIAGFSVTAGQAAIIGGGGPVSALSSASCLRLNKASEVKDVEMDVSAGA